MHGIHVVDKYRKTSNEVFRRQIDKKKEKALIGYSELLELDYY